MVKWVGEEGRRERLGKGGKWEKEGERQILLIGGKLYPLISLATLLETKARGLKRWIRRVSRQGGLRWTFLGERRGCNKRRRLGLKPAGEDKRQPL